MADKVHSSSALWRNKCIVVTSFNQNLEWNKEASSNLNSGDQIIHTITIENGQCFAEVPTGMCSADTASHGMYSAPPVSGCLLTSEYLRWSCYHLSKPNQTFHCDKHTVSFCTTEHTYLEMSIRFEHYVSNIQTHFATMNLIWLLNHEGQDSLIVMD